MEEIKLGATGDFPKGKLNENDEGGLRMAIFKKDDSVIIHFGKPIKWIGLPREDAKCFAETILRQLDEE